MATGERKAGKGMQFLFGGLSGMLATCVVQPLDLVKTRYRFSFSASPDRRFIDSFLLNATVDEQEEAAQQTCN